MARLAIFAERYTIRSSVELTALTNFRLAAFELLGRPDVPTGVAISEAVALASEYSTDESGRFVNGLVSRLARELRTDEGDSVRS